MLNCWTKPCCYFIRWTTKNTPMKQFDKQPSNPFIFLRPEPMQSDQSCQTPHEVNFWQLKKRQKDCSEREKKTGKKNIQKMFSLVHFVARFRCMLVLGNWLAIWMCFATIWHKWCSFTRFPVNRVEVIRYTSSLVVRQTLCNQSLEAHFATADKWKSPMKSANPASAGTGPKFCLLNAKDHSCHLEM